MTSPMEGRERLLRWIGVVEVPSPQAAGRDEPGRTPVEVGVADKSLRVADSGADGSPDAAVISFEREEPCCLTRFLDQGDPYAVPSVVDGNRELGRQERVGVALSSQGPPRREI